MTTKFIGNIPGSLSTGLSKIFEHRHYLSVPGSCGSGFDNPGLASVILTLVVLALVILTLVFRHTLVVIIATLAEKVLVFHQF